MAWVETTIVSHWLRQNTGPDWSTLHPIDQMIASEWLTHPFFLLIFRYSHGSPSLLY